MAGLQGTLIADFSSFVAAVDKAEASLRSFDADANKVEKSLNRVTDSFSGRKIIQDATLAAKAVADLGGASTLTESEQKRLNATLTEAIAKMKALGQEAPKAMVELAQATDQTKSPLEKLKAGLESVGISLGTLSVAAAGGALLRLGGDAIEFGSHLTDLSAKTGLTTDELQRLNYAGAQVGIGLDEIAAGVNKFQKNLVENGKPAQEALDKLGLSTSQLLALSPAEAFELVGQKLAAMPDPAQRSAAAMELLGKSGANLLPLLTENIKKLEEGATVMSAETIANLDRLDDAWAKFKINVQAGIGELLGDLSSLSGGFKQVVNALPAGSAASQTIDYLIHYRARADELNKSAEDAAKKLAGLAQTQRDGADAAQHQGLSTKELSDAEARLNKQVQASIKAHGEAKTKTDEHAKSIRALADSLTGQGLVQKAKDLDEAFLLVANEGKLSEAGMLAFAKASAELAKGPLGPAVLPAALHQLWVSTHNLTQEFPQTAASLQSFLRALPSATTQVRQLDAAEKELNDKFHFVTDTIEKAGGSFRSLNLILKDNHVQLSKAPKDMTDLGVVLGDLSQAFAQMAEIGGDSFGGIAKEIGTVVSAIHAAETAIGALEKILKQMDSSFKGFSASTKANINAGVGGFAIGASVADATGTRSGAKGALEGAASGAAYGTAVAPGIGTAVGAIAGAIGGYISARKAAAALREANNEASKSIADMQRQLVQQYGSVDQIDRLSKELGVDLIGAWGDQSQAGLKNFSGLAQEFQARMAALQSAVQDFGLTWRDLNHEKQIEAVGQQADALALQLQTVGRAGYTMDSAVRGAAGQLNDLLGAALSTGAQLPASLEPYIEQLIRTGKLTEENARAMLGLGAESGPSFGDVKDAADRYGLSLDALGPKIGQLDINEQAKQMSADWETLVGAGADVGAVMDGMKEKAQAVVTEALKFGDQIPESMKPMLQAMADAGQLTDDTGAKMTDLSKLTFAQDITKSIGDLVKVLRDMFGITETDGPAAYNTWAKSATDAAGKVVGPDGLAKVKAALNGGPGSVKQYLDDGSEEWRIWKEHTVQAAKDAASGVASQFNGLSFSVPVSFDYGSGPSAPPSGGPGGSSDTGGSQSEDDWAAQQGAPGASVGALVTPHGLRYLASGGPVWPWMPQGTDTVRAMLTPGEGVVNRTGMSLLGVEGLRRLNDGLAMPMLTHAAMARSFMSSTTSGTSSGVISLNTPIVIESVVQLGRAEFGRAVRETTIRELIKSGRFPNL